MAYFRFSRSKNVIITYSFLRRTNITFLPENEKNLGFIFPTVYQHPKPFSLHEKRPLGRRPNGHCKKEGLAHLGKTLFFYLKFLIRATAHLKLHIPDQLSDPQTWPHLQPICHISHFQDALHVPLSKRSVPDVCGI